MKNVWDCHAADNFQILYLYFRFYINILSCILLNIKTNYFFFFFYFSKTIENFFTRRYIEAEDKVICMSRFLKYHYWSSKAAASPEAGNDAWNVERFAGTHKFAIFIFLRITICDPKFSFEISVSRWPAFPFRYIEQCSASRQPLQSPFNYSINNHYCAIYYDDQTKFLEEYSYTITFSAWFWPSEKYVLFTCHMSYLFYFKASVHLKAT